MCGRYYVDDDTARAIEKIIRQLDEGSGQASRSRMPLQARDIHPADVAPILAASDQGLCCRRQRWGFPRPQGNPGAPGKQIIFNARSESAPERKMFRESVKRRRIVIPAAWFYEWSRNKEKNIFYRKDEPVLFMAGFYNRYGDEDRFVILTTAANESIRPVHDRMPLILEPDEVMPWIFEHGKTEAFLHKTPCLLERRTAFEQMSLF